MNGYYDPTHGQTSVHSLGIVVVLVLGVWMLLASRRYATFAIILFACIVPPAERIVVMGLDFTLLRVMVLFGWTRLIVRNELRNMVWRPMDTLFVAWLLCGTAIYTLQQQDAGGLVNRMGFLFEAGGMYFLFRCLILEWADIDRLAVSLVLISVPVMLAFLFEKTTRYNLFSVFAGTREITVMREGKLRCQGAFPHPIMAGVFWGSLLPLMGAAWWRGRNGRLLAVVGVVSGLVVVWASASSTSAAAALFVIAGALAFYMRHWMRSIRWGIAVGLAGLHLVMKAPVWHLIARVDITGGSTGYQRYMLFDQAVNHLSEWWLLGLRSTAHWGRGMTDVNNQYILEGLRGGMLTMGLFIALLVLGYKYIGLVWREVESNRYRTALVWAVGVSLFVHTLTFFGVSYFGQTPMVLYLHLAMAACMVSMTAEHDESIEAEAAAETVPSGPAFAAEHAVWR